MAIGVTCTNCGRKYKAEDEFAGKVGRCPGCGQPLVVPSVRAVDELSKSFAELDDWAFHTRPVRRRRLWLLVVGGVVAGLVLLGVFVLLTGRGLARAPRGGQEVAAPGGEAQPPSPSLVQPPPRPAGRRSALPAPQPARAQPPVIVTAPAPESGKEEDLADAAEAAQEGEHTGTACRSGRLEGELAVRLETVLAAYLAAAVPSDRAGIQTLGAGANVDVALEGRRYKGRMYRASTVYIMPDLRLDARELYVLTANAWQLTDQAYIPANTCISHQGGRYELADLRDLRAKAAERDAYVKKAIADVDAAAVKRDWEAAGKIMADALAAYPESGALTGRAARLARQPYYAVITAFNREKEPLRVRLDQAGRTVLDLPLAAGQTVSFEVQKGEYVGLWIGEHRVSSERVTVTNSERWVFVMGRVSEVPGLPLAPAWNRLVLAPQPRAGAGGPIP
jgi:hypothetical protein